ncbi:MAG TPA: LysR family transcriptional regulator [Burkholderiaceae bacterium]|nr:LysR family transcriptional regulator [Burkholderiaceae bacterium]
MHPGTKYLDTFLAAYETGSFVRAAEKLHVTQSTVSYQIKQFEAWLGTPLFERTGRRVLPSALAEQLYAVCGRFMGELNALRAGVQGGQAAARPVLRLATGSSFGRYVLTPLLASERYREAMLELRFGTDEDVCAAVANGQADAGFAYTVGASNALSFDLVYSYPLVLIAPYEMKLPRASKASAPSREDWKAWVEASSFITYDDYEETFTRWFETNFGLMPRQLRTAGHCTEIEETIALVAAGRGLSVVPRHTLAAATRAKTVREVALPGSKDTIDTVFFVSRTESWHDPVLDRLIEDVRAV